MALEVVLAGSGSIVVVCQLWDGVPTDWVIRTTCGVGVGWGTTGTFRGGTTDGAGTGTTVGVKSVVADRGAVWGNAGTTIWGAPLAGCDRTVLGISNVGTTTG